MGPQNDACGGLLIDDEGKILAFTEGLRALGLESSHIGVCWQEAFGDDLKPAVSESPGTGAACEACRLAHGDDVYELVAHALADPDGAARQLLSVTRVTDREALSHLALRLDGQAALADLVAGIAHEINNPLTYVSGWLQIMLEDGGPAVEPGESRLQRLQDEIARVSKIVTNLLSFARPTPPAQEWVQVDELLGEMLELVEYQMRNSNITIERDFPSDVPKILADPGSLRQAFLNLFINAKHAMPDGGTLTVEVAAIGEEIQIRIRDTGVGIALEDLPRVFSRGFTTKADAGGTGLGLPVCRDIIRLHGGSIFCLSEPGRGTAFTIRLPLYSKQEADQPAARPAPLSERSAAAPARRLPASVSPEPSQDRREDSVETGNASWQN